MTRARPARIKVEILVQSPAWRRVKDARTVIRRALAAAAESLTLESGEVAVVLTDDEAIQALNRQWRGFDKPTNVLSFPSVLEAATGHIGDIVIAYETMAREAEADDKTLRDHLAHMAVHGFLHLAGLDHENARDAKRMEGEERAILAGLGIADPYADASLARSTKGAANNRKRRAS